MAESFRRFFFRLRSRYRRFLYALFSFLPIQRHSLTFVWSGSGMGVDFYGSLWEVARDDGRFILNVCGKSSPVLGSLRIMYRLARSHVIIANCTYSPLEGITIRSGSTAIQVWHAASAFKKFGVVAQKSEYDRRRFQRMYAPYAYFITSAPGVTPHYARAFGLSESLGLPLGAYKSDDLYKAAERIPELKDRLFEEHPLAKGKKVILYAPTFRAKSEGGISQRSYSPQELPLPCREFAELLGEQYFIGIRLHPKHALRFLESDHGIGNFGEWKEAEILACADILVSDYSTIMAYFAFFGRSMYFYAPDLDLYEKERGFFISYNEFVPGRICKTIDDLVDSIRNEAESGESSANFWNKHMSGCDGNVSRKIIRLAAECMGIE